MELFKTKFNFYAMIVLMVLLNPFNNCWIYIQIL